MNMDFLRKLPVPVDVKSLYPLPEKYSALKAQRDKEIAEIFTGNSDKILLR